MRVFCGVYSAKAQRSPTSNFPGKRSFKSRRSRCQHGATERHRQLRVYADTRDHDPEIAQQDFLEASSYIISDAKMRNKGVSASPAVSDNDIWASKPPWCQPWTIVLSGASAVAAAWKLSGESTLVSLVVAIPVAIWWYLFLGVMPQAYREYVDSLPSQPR